MQMPAFFVHRARPANGIRSFQPYFLCRAQPSRKQLPLPPVLIQEHDPLRVLTPPNRLQFAHQKN